nr:MAG TPA: hypothetical protein [Caudoviricetes sp.]
MPALLCLAYQRNEDFHGFRFSTQRHACAN